MFLPALLSIFWQEISANIHWPSRQALPPRLMWHSRRALLQLWASSGQLLFPLRTTLASPRPQRASHCVGRPSAVSLQRCQVTHRRSFRRYLSRRRLGCSAWRWLFWDLLADARKLSAVEAHQWTPPRSGVFFWPVNSDSSFLDLNAARESARVLALSPADLVEHLARLSPLNNCVVGGCACWSCPPWRIQRQPTPAREPALRSSIARGMLSQFCGPLPREELRGFTSFGAQTVTSLPQFANRRLRQGNFPYHFAAKKHDNGIGWPWGLRSSLPNPCNFESAPGGPSNQQ